jgi:hypothetical protein
MTLLGFKTILHKKCRSGKNPEGPAENSWVLDLCPAKWKQISKSLIYCLYISCNVLCPICLHTINKGKCLFTLQCLVNIFCGGRGRVEIINPIEGHHVDEKNVRKFSWLYCLEVTYRFCLSIFSLGCQIDYVVKFPRWICEGILYWLWNKK